MSDEYEFDLGWHSLNYRTAGINEAHRCWQELEACVNRLVAREVNAANANLKGHAEAMAQELELLLDFIRGYQGCKFLVAHNALAAYRLAHPKHG